MSDSPYISVVTKYAWPVAEKPTPKIKVPAPPVLTYRFDTPLPTAYKGYFDSAKAEWTKYAYLEFREAGARENPNILIIFKDGRGSKSQVGKRQFGRPTEVTFGREGCTQRNFLHEFGHVLGFEHEHQRPDREDSEIKICEKPGNKGWATNYFDQVDPETLAAASLGLDKDSIMIYPIEGTEIKLNQDLSARDKAFTMLMYPGRKPDDMTIDAALTAANIHVPKDYTKLEREKGKIANDIKGCIGRGDYESARKKFITYNKSVLDQLQVLYNKHIKDQDTKSKKDAKGKKKSDVETQDDFENFLSTAVKEAVEWVTNNPGDDNDDPNSEENADE